MSDSANTGGVIILCIIVLGIFGMLGFTSCSCRNNVEYETVTVRMTIIEKTYTPATSGSGGGLGISMSGNPVILPQQSGTSAKFTLHLRDEAGNVERINVSEFAYYEAKIGDIHDIQREQRKR